MTTNPQQSNRPIDYVLAHLGNVHPHGSSSDQWMATCPAHEDAKPSLSVKRADDAGCVLLHCFAGCKTEVIVQTLGLAATDLFAKGCPQHKKRVSNKKNGGGGGAFQG